MPPTYKKNVSSAGPVNLKRIQAPVRDYIRDVMGFQAEINPERALERCGGWEDCSVCSAQGRSLLCVSQRLSPAKRLCPLCSASSQQGGSEKDLLK